MSRPLYRGCPLFGGSIIRGSLLYLFYCHANQATAQLCRPVFGPYTVVQIIARYTFIRVPLYSVIYLHVVCTVLYPSYVDPCAFHITVTWGDSAKMCAQQMSMHYRLWLEETVSRCEQVWDKGKQWNVFVCTKTFTASKYFEILLSAAVAFIPQY